MTEKTEAGIYQIRKTYIEEKAESIMTMYNFKNVDVAFQSMVYSLIFGVEYDDIPEEEIVDGGQDKQIDIFRIEEDEANAIVNVHLIQSKNEDGFSSNKIIQIGNGLRWIFEAPKKDYDSIENLKFKTKIDEFRELRKKHGSSNINVFLYYASKGDEKDLSNEYLQEKHNLTQKYESIGLNSFTFDELGTNGIFSIINQNEKNKKRINLDIPIIYDVNKPSIIEFNSGGTSALICTMKGSELAKLAMTEYGDSIFDSNVRTNYGVQGKVNSEIRRTCSDDKDAPLFWFLNNGVTILCDSFDPIKDPDHPIVKTSNIQIVNGCQTTSTLRDAFDNAELLDTVKVLVRIYSTENPKLVDKITYSTNNQNRITDRDLRANDEIQMDLQRVLSEKYGYFYERKNKEYSYIKGINRRKVIQNTKAAQAVLAISRKKPSIARGYQGKIWNEYYSEIYNNVTAEDFLLCYKTLDICEKKSKIIDSDPDMDKMSKEVAIYGRYHIARIMGFYMVNDKWSVKNRKSIESTIEDLDEGKINTDELYERSLKLMVQIRKKSKAKQPNPALYFKALDVQKDIEKSLKGNK